MAFKIPFIRGRSRDAPPKAEQRQNEVKNEAVEKSKKTNLRKHARVWNHTWASGDFSLANNESIFAAVTRISNTFASVKFHLYKDRQIQRDHPLEKLIAGSPNYAQTPYGFQQTMEAFRNTTGNAYALKVPRIGGGIDRLDIIDPARVIPVLNTDTGELWYRLNADNGEIYVHGKEMIHTRYVCTNGYEGISPVRVLFNTLDYDAKIKEFSLRQLTDGIHSPITLDIPSEVDSDKKDKIVEDFIKHYKQSSGSLIVLDAGAKASRLTGNIVDAKVFDIERITRNRVATVYSIPPHMLGDYSDSSYATNEQSMLEFLQLTMYSIFTMYGQEYDKKLLTAAEIANGYYFSADYNQLLLADTATRGDYNSKAIRSAGKTPNEIRRSNGDPDHPDGDELLFSRDLVPLSVLKQLAAEYAGSLGGGEDEE